MQMFKIQKGYDDKVYKSFRLPTELVDRLNILAGKNCLSLNALVVQCLEYAIDNLEEDDEDGSKE